MWKYLGISHSVRPLATFLKKVDLALSGTVRANDRMRSPKYSVGARMDSGFGRAKERGGGCGVNF